MKYALTFDSTPSVRTKDENGFLHVALTPISKATVNPYLGKEIEGSKEHGFEPDKIYYGLRDPDELAKGAGTARPLQAAILLFCISFPWGWS